MVASVSVKFDFGGSDGNPGTQRDIDALGPPNLKFKTADDTTIDLENPVPVPVSGTKYSFWKHIYLYCDVAPDIQIDNVRLYTDGTGYGTGITINVGLQFPTKNSGSNAGYEVATGTVGDTGDEVVAGHGGITSVVSLFSKIEASPLVISISEAGSVIDNVGESTNYIVLQAAVVNTASPGNPDNETITFKYDEI